MFYFLGGLLGWIRADYEEGYDLALDLLDDLDLPDEQAQSIDVARMLQDLGIAVSQEVMADDGLRGVALAGPDYGRQSSSTLVTHDNQRESGYRFTLAHELCHVLHDRGYARWVSLVTARSRTTGQRLRRYATDATGVGEPAYRLLATNRTVRFSSTSTVRFGYGSGPTRHPVAGAESTDLGHHTESSNAVRGTR